MVPGVAVYGHLAHLPVREFGETWLAHSVDNLRLIKPAYHDEQIDLSMTSADDLHTVTCHDRDGLLLANLTTSMPAQLPAPENPELLDGDYKYPERVEITWETVVPNQDPHVGLFFRFFFGFFGARKNGPKMDGQKIDFFRKFWRFRCLRR